MRWSIRNQILLPVAGVVLLAVAAATAVAALLAARDRERATLDQLTRVVTTLAEARFPINDTIVSQMRGLTGAHFIALDEQQTLVVSTLSLPADGLTRLTRHRSGELADLTRQPALSLGSDRYLVAAIERPTNPTARWLYVLAPEAKWRREQWFAALYPLSVGLMAVLLTAGVSFLLGQRLAQRLQVLQGQTAAIAGGEFSAIPPRGPNDELRDLEISVNQMAERLRELQATVASGERQRLLAQIAGGLAHQLRNAATGARLALQLHETRCHPPAGDRSLAVALRQLSLLEMQVRGLLSLGKPDRREPTQVAVETLFSEVIPLVEPACEHTGVRLKTAGVPPCVTVQGDAQALQAAVLNLALNAVEAAGRGGWVEMRSRLQDRDVLLEVLDSGPGPSPQVAQHLGEPFVTSKPEGVGLGLLLVRQVADELGGSLTWARGHSQTLFTLRLPLGPTAPSPASPDSASLAPHSLTGSSSASRAALRIAPPNSARQVGSDLTTATATATTAARPRTIAGEA